jgi:hypothetical protein
MCYYRNAKINFKRYDQLTADLRRSHYHIVILVTTRLIYNSYVSCYLLFIIYNYTINKPIVNRLRIPKQGIITINNRSVFIIWQNRMSIHEITLVTSAALSKKYCRQINIFNRDIIFSNIRQVFIIEVSLFIEYVEYPDVKCTIN